MRKVKSYPSKKFLKIGVQSEAGVWECDDGLVSHAFKLVYNEESRKVGLSVEYTARRGLTWCGQRIENITYSGFTQRAKSHLWRDYLTCSECIRIVSDVKRRPRRLSQNGGQPDVAQTNC
jgi:hypothetical protein